MSNFRKRSRFRDQVDFDAIHSAADVQTVAETYLEQGRTRGRFFCPVCHKDNVTAKQTVWGCWSCGAHKAGADAVGLVAVATGTSRIEAAKRLAGELGIGPVIAGSVSSRPGQRPAVQPKPPEPEPYEQPSWCEWISGQVEQSHECLMNRSDDVSRRAWDYLIRRGLLPETIEVARLGVNLEWSESVDAIPGRDDPCYLPPGIVIPWCSGPFGLSGANVRQFHKRLQDKYIMATGSRRRWIYPRRSGWESWTGPVVVVEGEFDALLAWQELSGLLPVVTLGGAQCSPADTYDAGWLGLCSRLLIAADSDEAGDECRALWRDFSPRRTVSVDLPGGKDITEAHVAGADLRKWLIEVCRPLEIDLRALPGLVWEKPLGTIRGRAL